MQTIRVIDESKFGSDGLGDVSMAYFNDALRIHVKYVPEDDTANRNVAFTLGVEIIEWYHKLMFAVGEVDAHPLQKIKNVQDCLTNIKDRIEALLIHFGKGKIACYAHHDQVFNEFLDRYGPLSDVKGWLRSRVTDVFKIVGGLTLEEDE